MLVLDKKYAKTLTNKSGIAKSEQKKQNDDVKKGEQNQQSY